MEVIAGRYEVVQRCGQGGSSVVYKVFDRSLGRVLALKELLRAGPVREDFQWRFKQEFTLMASLRHPHIVSVYDFGRTEAGNYYFTMDFVDGQPITEWAEALDWEGIASLLFQVASALCYIHSQRVIHGDIKPTNIVVRKDVPSDLPASLSGSKLYESGFAVLMDFGLSALLSEPALRVSGTIEYMAPERFVASRGDARSDLYSLGVLAYQLFAGRLPFQADTIEGFVEQHRSVEPKPLALLAPGLPPLLIETVHSLLAKRPAQRLGSASEFLARLARLLGPKVPSGFVISPNLRPARLFGRAEAVERVLRVVLGRLSADAYRRVFEEEPALSEEEYADLCQVVVLAGAPGAGRTAMLEALKSELQLLELGTLSSASGSQSLGLEQFIRSTLASAGLASESHAVLGPASQAAGPGADVRPQSAQQAVIEDFLDGLKRAWQARPTVWLIDDFDLLGRAARETVLSVARSVCSLRAGRRMVIVLTGAPGCASLLEGLQDEVVVEQVDLPGLDDAQIASWLDAAFIPNSFEQTVSSILQEKTGGLPALLVPSIESLFTEGIVYFSDGRWNVDSERLQRFSPAQSLSGAVETKLSQLSAPAMSVLVKAVILREPFNPQLVAEIGQMPSQEVHQAVEELVKHGLIVETQVGSELAWYAVSNPITSEVVLARLSEEEASAIHRLIARGGEEAAERLEKSPEPQNLLGYSDPETSCAHLRAMSALHACHAGLDDVLMRNYESAYQFLVSRFDYQQAKFLTDRIRQLARRPGSGIGLERALMRLGNLDFLLGDHDAAIREFNEAITVAGDLEESIVDVVEATCKLGVIYSGRGQFEEAQRLCERVIAQLETAMRGGSPKLRRRLRPLLARLYTFLGQTHFGTSEFGPAQNAFSKALKLIPKGLAQALQSDKPPKMRSELVKEADYLPRLFRNLAIIADSAGRYQQARRLSEKAIRAGRLIGDVAEQARNLVTHGTISQHLKDYDRAQRCYEEALDYFAREGFKEGLSIVHNNLASIMEQRGRLKEAEFQYNKALLIARKLGNRYAIARTLRNLGAVLRQRGWLDEAERRVDESLKVSRQSGLAAQEAMCHLDKAYIALQRGEFAQARKHLDEAVHSAASVEDDHFLLTLRLAEATILNAEGEFERAKTIASDVIAKSSSLGFLDICLSAYCQRGRALMRLGQFDPASDDIAEATGLARQTSDVLGEGFCLELESELREAQGNLVAAIEAGQRALALYKRVEAFLKVGQLAQRLSSLLLSAGKRSDALLMLELARDQYAGLDMKQQASQIEERIEELRWGRKPTDERGSLAIKALYNVSRLFESLLDIDELLNNVMDAVIEILGAERGLIMLKDARTGALQTRVARKVDKETIEDVTRISKSVIKRVVDLGTPIVTTDAQSDPRFRESKSVSLYDIRSLVCVPLVIHGKVAGTIYVDSSLSATVFTKEDLYLLSAFATQASMAIEKAMLLEELQRSKAALQAENIDLREAIAPSLAFENIVGATKPMLEVFRRIRQVADTDVNVLIEGESGTGKELVARAVHHNSRRKDGPFVKINCAAIPESLMENELFGHEKGAYTGADRRKIGRFEVADGGSLFLDEIGDLPLPLQAKLLTAIENKEFQRVGGTKTIHVDVRILTATNMDLKRLIAEKRFREDLFYRINEVPVKLPPLRERKEDIPLLVQHFIDKYRDELNSPVTGIDKGALSVLMQYSWPGNVRELESAVKRALIDASDRILGSRHFGFLPGLRRDAQARAEAEDRLVNSLLSRGLPLKDMLGIVERQLLVYALKLNNWNIRRTAEDLGIARNTLKAKIAAYSITPEG